ncbi:MAG: hypothetical protein J6Q61_01020 [Bacteroidales bacterium]|nr:hypothetical protein [Bacteroidales bacterium]
MQITYWRSFTKRKNSTKIPHPDYGITISNAELKSETSTENPIFEVVSNHYDINYLSAFGNYYYVTDLQHVTNGIIRLICKMDDLATHRAEILDSYQYILRTSDAAEIDYRIIDTAIPIKTVPDVRAQVSSTPDIFTGNNNTLLLTIKGPAGSQFVAMNVGLYKEVGEFLYSLDQDDVWDVLQTSITKTYLDPFGYITDAKIFPIDLSKISDGSLSDTLKLGYWEYTDPDGAQIFRYLDHNVFYESSEITLTPNAGESVRTFLNSNRYRQFSLVLPGVGMINLDADLVNDIEKVKIKFTIDIAGTISYKVKLGYHEEFFSGVIAAPMAVHGSVFNTGLAAKGIGSLASIAAAAGTGLAIGGPAGAAVGGIGAAITSGISLIGNAQPLVRTETTGVDGSLGSFVINKSIILEETRYTIAGDPRYTIGNPCCKRKQLSTITAGSYIQCQNANIDINGLFDSKVRVDEALNNGIFLD